MQPPCLTEHRKDKDFKEKRETVKNKFIIKKRNRTKQDNEFFINKFIN